MSDHFLRSVIDPFVKADYTGLPLLRAFQARDESKLHYRTYPCTPAGPASHVAVLIHGSSGSGIAMHRLALALQKAGVTCYVPDMRGHGRNLPRGDIRYVGQLEHDLEDLLRIVTMGRPERPVSLVGHSCGGGFLLRFSTLPQAAAVKRFVLLAPAMAWSSPFWRPGQRWAHFRRLRLQLVRASHAVGVRWLDGLKVVRFPIPRELESILTPAYSWRMIVNFNAPGNDCAAIAALGARVSVLIGAEDELFEVERYGALERLNPHLRVQVLAGVCHSDIVIKEEALRAVVDAIVREDAAAR